jgi:hypothetical protein
VNSNCLVLLLTEDVKKDVHMDKVADIRPTAELSPEMIKTICDAISQEFYRWELNEEDDSNLKCYQTICLRIDLMLK